MRTRQICQAVATHPQRGETVWFNQAHLFHVSSLKPEVRKTLEGAFGIDGLPRNACFGDGMPIPEEDLEQIRQTQLKLEARAALNARLKPKKPKQKLSNKHK